MQFSIQWLMHAISAISLYKWMNMRLKKKQRLHLSANLKSIYSEKDDTQSFVQVCLYSGDFSKDVRGRQNSSRFLIRVPRRRRIEKYKDLNYYSRRNFINSAKSCVSSEKAAYSNYPVIFVKFITKVAKTFVYANKFLARILWILKETTNESVSRVII